MSDRRGSVEEILLSSDDSDDDVLIISDPKSTADENLLASLKENARNSPGYLPGGAQIVAVHYDKNLCTTEQTYASKNSSNWNHTDSFDIEVMSMCKRNSTSSSVTNDDVDEDNLDNFDDQAIDLSIKGKKPSEKQFNDLNVKLCDIGNTEQCNIANKELSNSTNVEIYNNSMSGENGNVNGEQRNDTHVKELEPLNADSSSSTRICKELKPGDTDDQTQKLLSDKQKKRVLRCRSKHFIELYCKTCNTNVRYTKRRSIGNNYRLRYKCKECDGKLTFKCKICNTLEESLVSIFIHLKRNCGTGAMHRCTRCPYTIGTALTLEAHMRRVHGESKYKTKKPESGMCCDVCAAEFQDQGELTSHKRTCVPKDTTPKKYRCESCGTDYSYQKTLTAHKKSCVAFNNKSTNVKSMYTDRKAVSTERKIQDEISSVENILQMYCTKCDVYRKSDNSKNYCFTCYNPLLWQCVNCEKRSKSYCGIYEHVMNECERRYQYQCRCGEKFIAENDLTSHTISCSKIYIFCELCNYKTKNKYLYRNHLKRMHNKENIKAFCK